MRELEVAEDLLKKALRRSPGHRYLDVLIAFSKGVELAIRGGDREEATWSNNVLSVRALTKGYSVASSTNTGVEELDKLVSKAISLSSTSPEAGLAPVEIRRGRATRLHDHLDTEEAWDVVNDVYNRMRSRLSDLSKHYEVVLTIEERGKSVASSEGCMVVERSGYITLIAYALGRRVRSSVAVGALRLDDVRAGGVESRVVEIAELQANSRSLSPFYHGARFKVVLDEECSGALAHEIAHSLEADTFSASRLPSRIPEYLRVVDDPSLAHGFGWQMWDDEGVEAKAKELLSRDGLRLLNTRLTAYRGLGSPGNARGLTHKPRPMMSNVVMERGDWGDEEVVEDSVRGFKFVGLEEARLDLSSNLIYIKPQVSVYFDKRGEVLIPVQDAVLVDDFKRVLESLDAATKRTRVRPNLERGYPVSEAAPKVRLNQVRVEKRPL